MQTLSELAARLCALSRDRCVEPETLDWPDAFEADAWFISPELLSIYGTSEYEALDERQRRSLSFFEALNFFSLNIHNETYLVSGLAAWLEAPAPAELKEYLRHFRDEENEHRALFGGFCARYGKVYPPRTFALPPPAEEDQNDAGLMFFAKVLIFEEIVDAYNRHIARDARVTPIARAINRIHHCDEARHLAFGRALLRDLHERSVRRRSVEARRRLDAYLGAYTESLWREYYNPSVYRDAGLDDAYGLARRAWTHGLCQAHRAKMSARCRAFLGGLGAKPLQVRA